ncbi:hypothetical protein WN51_02060 [Melipona quadrifasciata]|uniref:Uncharacterized protein n=1 Tax=Melipona quadrifasciata TaxID=166423 RepID=A0A0M8ZZX4_9HYME|nr:hypothetical protein WN51_02060 [Melipona quadrifasciata]
MYRRCFERWILLTARAMELDYGTLTSEILKNLRLRMEFELDGSLKEWVKDKPLSILQLDPADRAVLRIAEYITFTGHYSLKRNLFSKYYSSATPRPVSKINRFENKRIPKGVRGNSNRERK